ncbi:protein translocase SEC61 complex subunit gamma [Candidatus Woesearchaeota archaeon]|nr:protein translocase SEC61 complex subunit gamma [Candidatus Woesearchaeota archaeon]
MSIWGRLSEFWVECKRVLRITKKPDKQEYLTIVKVSGLGILAIGLIGFILHMIYQFIIT